MMKRFESPRTTPESLEFGKLSPRLSVSAFKSALFPQAIAPDVKDALNAEAPRRREE
jgi:hypothetical protein